MSSRDCGDMACGAFIGSGCAFIGCDKAYEGAEYVLFGAPYDSTASFRPGSRFASKCMRADSFGMETYSPYQDKDLEDAFVCDAGDLNLGAGNTELALEKIEGFVNRVINGGKKPAMIGGEHLVSLGAVRALRARYPELRVVQFDAHADLRDDYQGARLSHATVMRRCWEVLGDGRIYQFGIRSGDKSEFIWSEGRTRLAKFGFSGLEDAVSQLKSKPVYFTLDLDVLDPSVLPGTGTPEAGGANYESLAAAAAQLSQLNIVGFDMVELAPAYDPGGMSTAVACKLFREILLMFCKKGK